VGKSESGSLMPKKDQYKISNSYRSMYTRLIELTCPDLKGFITKKSIHLTDKMKCDFADFHKRRPNIMQQIVLRLREVKAARKQDGVTPAFKKVGIALAVERVRWYYEVENPE